MAHTDAKPCSGKEIRSQYAVYGVPVPEASRAPQRLKRARFLPHLFEDSRGLFRSDAGDFLSIPSAISGSGIFIHFSVDLGGSGLCHYESRPGCDRHTIKDNRFVDFVDCAPIPGKTPVRRGRITCETETVDSERLSASAKQT
jgi:hypothetical protein